LQGCFEEFCDKRVQEEVIASSCKILQIWPTGYWLTCDVYSIDFAFNFFQGDANFICGGPPCQGVSGFNRFRNAEAPLEDIKNKQLIVYMDIIDFLKPKYILMENVVDILKFSGGYLGRYAIGRLVAMNYQARMGMMAAGSYGLPQFRMRVFLWGARPTEVKLLLLVLI